MNIKDSIKIANANFRRHKLRTALSVLGIVIGILSVSLIVSLGQGVKGYVVGQVSAFGTDVIVVASKVPGKGTMGTMTSMVQGITVTSLKKEDFEAIEDFEFVESQTSYAFGQVWTSYKGNENNVFCFTTGHKYADIDQQAKIAQGRFYNQREERGTQKVVVLGKDAKENLFGSQTAVGKDIKVKQNSFRVIGVMQERGQIAGFDYDNMIFVPLKTGQKFLLGIDYVVEGLVKVRPGTDMNLAVTRIESLLRRRHNISDPAKDDFMVMSMDEALEIAETITQSLSILLVFLAGISLLVGGIGIMNIMLVSLSERIKEVGLRKALGARDRDILNQFLVESTLLTGIGGSVGIVLGFLFTILGAFAARKMGMDWTLSFPFVGFAIAFTVAVSTGIIFGAYPARKAAQLDPIDALRYE